MVFLRWIQIAGWTLGLVAAASSTRAAPGDDVVEIFARASQGAPLRYVAIGGSITQASGPGWVGDWLRETFPESQVVTVNSGISGTGTSLGVFRVERDVIAHQPDLVAIEYCVNDGGLPDEETIRYLESMVVRLKSLPHPPAIVILESAASFGVNLERHRRVAQHYDLLEVDFQAAVNAKLRAEKLPWTTLFGDNVHPNRAGHAFYADVFRAALTPLAERARAAGRDDTAKPATLPAPLSAKPLLLDARMVPLHGRHDPASDWRAAPAPATDWGRFFQGLLAAEMPGATLRIPFRGTVAGLFFVLNKNHGSFLANIDGRTPVPVFTNLRNGFSSVIVEPDLPAGDHTLNLVLPRDASADPDFVTQGPVQLGYLLVAGETHVARGTAPVADSGPFDADTLRDLRFETLPTAGWQWTGPFATLPSAEGTAPVDAIADILRPLLPELETNPTATQGINWRPTPESSRGGLIDLRALTGSTAPALAYARTTWTGPSEQSALLWVEVDYYARLWLNGERILALEGPHRTPVIVPVKLRAGSNEFLLKLGAGSGGFSARLRIAPYTPKN